VPLVVDPVMVASSGARLLQEDAIETLVDRLLPLATVVTPNLAEAEVLAAVAGPKRELAERIHDRGAAAVIVTGGHGDPVDHLFDGREHVEIEVPRYEGGATHGAGCTHSATLAAELAKGASLREAAYVAATVAGEAVRTGLSSVGEGDGPVDVFDLERKPWQLQL
jgi:hydroxymethylpyrimidine/phosphomethylpyrimidine kinase